MILWPWPRSVTSNNNRHLPLSVVINCTKRFDSGAASCLQRILPRFPTLWQYNFDLWPLILKNKRHFPLIMVNTCRKEYDPGAYGSFCILPTTFSYNVTIRPWQTISIFLSSCWSTVPSCKILEPGTNGSRSVSCHVFLIYMWQYDLDLDFEKQ